MRAIPLSSTTTWFRRSPTLPRFASRKFCPFRRSGGRSGQLPSLLPPDGIGCPVSRRAANGGRRSFVAPRDTGCPTGAGHPASSRQTRRPKQPGRRRTPWRSCGWRLTRATAGSAKAFSLGAFHLVFGEGRDITQLDDGVIAVATGCGLTTEEALAAPTKPEIKAALRSATEEAVSRGVVGVPTVAIGEQLYWGDDRLEEAAAATGADQP